MMAVAGQMRPGFPREKARTTRRTDRQSLTDRCDIVFSKLVRRNGVCVHCGSTANLECAHGFGRSYRATRWDLRNGFCLCHGDHRWFTEHPLEWDTWLRLRMADYDDVRLLAVSGTEPDLEELLASLRALHRRSA